jgi:hypothetical protein
MARRIHRTARGRRRRRASASLPDLTSCGAVATVHPDSSASIAVDVDKAVTSRFRFPVPVTSPDQKTTTLPPVRNPKAARVYSPPGRDTGNSDESNPTGTGIFLNIAKGDELVIAKA